MSSNTRLNSNQVPVSSGTGSQGFQGSNGFQGNIGSNGFQGFQGNIGSNGFQGFQGVIGLTGSQGFQGIAGNTGSQGVAGVGFTGSSASGDLSGSYPNPTVVNLNGQPASYYAKESDLLALNDLPLTPILGTTSNLAVAFATTRIVGSASKAFRLRRSSDNFQQDFYFDNTGIVTTNDILKFVDGNRGYVSVWYDQSGNGNNAVQGTASLQPYVVIESGMVRVRYENITNLYVGQNLTYTLSNLPSGATGVNVNNTTVFCAYSSYVTSGKDNVYPAPNYTSRYLMSSQNAGLNLYIDGANGTHPDALSINGTSSNTLFSWCHNNYWSINSNLTNTKIRSNYVGVTQSVVSSLIENQFTIGNKYGVNGNPFEGDIFAFVQFATSQPDSEIDALAANLDSIYDLISPSDSALNIAIVGDSITNGIGSTNNQNWPRYMNTIKKSPVVNTARSSNTYVIQNSNNYNVSLDSMVVPGKINVLFIWIGTNDLSGATSGPTTATQSYADTQSFVSARRTAGWNKVVVFTAIDRGSQATFLTFNTLLTSDTTHFDGVIDVASDPRLNYYPGYGNVSNFAQPDYGYSFDTIHLTSVGYKAVSAYADDFIESLSIQSPVYTLGRRIKTLEDTITDLSSKAILNRKAQQPGNLGVTGSIYASVLSGSQKPLTDLHIRANDVTNTSNTGDIYIRDTAGFGRLYFGLTATPYANAGTYVFAGPASNSLTTDYYNPSTASPLIQLNFLNDGGHNPITNSYIQAPGSGKLLSYAIYGNILGAGQGAASLQSGGINEVNAFYIYAGGYASPAVSIGPVTSPTAVLHVAPGGTYSSQMRLQSTSILATASYQHDGDMWYDGTHLNARFAGNLLQIDTNTTIDVTTTAYTKSTINAAYPTAKKGYVVVCNSITAAGQTYIKLDDSSTGNWSSYVSTQLGG